MTFTPDKELVIHNELLEETTGTFLKETSEELLTLVTVGDKTLRLVGKKILGFGDKLDKLHIIHFC